MPIGRYKYDENEHLKPKEGEKKHIAICDLYPEEVDKLITDFLSSLPTKGGKKTNTAWSEDLLLLRDSVILSLMTENGLSKWRTCQQIMSRWDISSTTAKKYINEAIHRFAEEVTDKGETIKKVFLEKMENIASTAIERDQLDTAIRAFTEVGKMMGFYSNKQDINLKTDGIKIDFTFNED